MPTKAELEEQIVALVDELAQKQEVIEKRDAQIKKLEAKFVKEVSDDITKVLDRNCINCGMSGRTTYDAKSERFTCAFCNYQWAMEAEQAPFRR
ncbi:MAG: hypothetical protein KAT00_03400 [Planctomycetes bacterium]|nr:hypothetical protein [Planctomycetota bacterium]